MKILTRVEHGRIIRDDAEAIRKYIQSRDGKALVIDITVWTGQRTPEQNRLYWMYIGIISEDTGEDKDGLHRHFASKYLIDRSGKIPTVRSTSELTTTEFMDYLRSIQRDVAEFGIYLPEPEERDLL